MDLMIGITLKKLPVPISYRDKILLIGSCFTEHIGDALAELKFSVMQNPNGILFGPDSVSKSLISYIENKQYSKTELFQLNELWHSWQHHSRFSDLDADAAIQNINASQQRAHEFLKKANWLIITLGSAFIYRLTTIAELAKTSLPTSGGNRDGVANCHRAPANWFNKEMLEIDAIITLLEESVKQLRQFNPGLKFIFTVSPVRHIRDGVVDNNRSKARLIEAVHQIVNQFDSVYYFAAYELVIDVLRDYRFYDADLVHPNYPATEFVLEKFAETCIDETSQHLMQEVKQIVTARKHKAFQPETKAHSDFLAAHAEKTKLLQKQYPFLDMQEELVYFSNT